MGARHYDAGNPVVVASRADVYGVLLSAAAVGIVLTVVFGDLPGTGHYIAVLQDACHAPAFFTLALILLVLLGRSAATRGRSLLWRATLVLPTLLLIGIGTELWQSQIGRDAEVTDVISDLIGAGAGTSFWWYGHLRDRSDGPARLHRAAALLICLALGALWLTPVVRCGLAYWRRDAQFPVLAQFHSPLDQYFITGGIQQQAALRVPLERGEWPGMTLEEPVADWRGLHELLLDLGNPSQAALPLGLRINDRSHTGAYEDRFNTHFQLPPLVRTTLHIPLDQVARAPRGRPMDMSHIKQLILFGSGGTTGRAVLVYRIWLQ
jgi:hypothetical protein